MTTTVADMTRLWASWEAWAQSANRAESGWESSFPQWAALMDSAKQSLLGDLSPAALKIMERCWAASQENEELLDFARDHITECWPNVAKLAQSAIGACRWQAYAAAPAIGHAAEGVLRPGLDDGDAYARRRAALALASLAPADAASIAHVLARDADPYIRQAAVEMALASPDVEGRRALHAILSKDEVDHVRTASEKLAG